VAKIIGPTAFLFSLIEETLRDGAQRSARQLTDRPSSFLSSSPVATEGTLPAGMHQVAVAS
jgi:hypothetical protein